MIKNFEDYSKEQELAGGQTQWKKSYSDGESALLVINNREISRQKVRKAFIDQKFKTTGKSCNY